MLGEIKQRATVLYVKSVKSSLCSSTQTLISRIWEFFHGTHSRDPSVGEQREAISYLMVGVGVVKEGDTWLNHTSRQAQLPEMSVSIIIRLWSEASCSLAMLERTTEDSNGKVQPTQKEDKQPAGGRGAVPSDAWCAKLRLWQTLKSAVVQPPQMSWGSKEETWVPQSKDFPFSMIRPETFLTELFFAKVVFIVVPGFEALKGTQQ